ncbi:MAG: hypothetical protein M0P34_03745 [Desulfocurvus sp.]|nr:hypothetical protein [Desulfocurvus sp.]
MHTERRHSPRMTVEGIGFVTLTLKGAYEVMGTLEAVSRSGLLLALLPTGPESEPAPGDGVTLGELPVGLADLMAGRPGHVVWADDTHCGISLDRPLDISDAALQRTLRENNLLPWTQWRG